MTGWAPIASIAANTAMFSAGNEPDRLTATRLPGPTPACFSQPTATAAKSGWRDSRLASGGASVVVIQLYSGPLIRGPSTAWAFSASASAA